MTEPHMPLDRYRIRIRGQLDPAWSAWFDDLAIVQEADETFRAGDRVRILSDGRTSRVTH